MEFTQRFFPQDKQRLEQLGSRDVVFFTAGTPQPENWLLCIVHTLETMPDKKLRRCLSVTVRPAWGMIRGRRPTDEEVEAVKSVFSRSELAFGMEGIEEDNQGVKDTFVRRLWGKEIEGGVK